MKRKLTDTAVKAQSQIKIKNKRDSSIGDLKVGDLSGIQVFKYKHKSQLYLIAYEYIDDKLILTFIEHVTHEDFYRDLKKKP